MVIVETWNETVTYDKAVSFKAIGEHGEALSLLDSSGKQIALLKSWKRVSRVAPVVTAKASSDARRRAIDARSSAILMES